ncbi:MAG TPA: diguanylate cyclase, partial [Baekduia sp.]
LARHGGDEFALLLPATSEDGAEHVVERLHAAHPTPWSSGAAAWPRGASLDSALAAADAKLYVMKRRRDEGGGDAGRPAPAPAPTPPLPASRSPRP